MQYVNAYLVLAALFVTWFLGYAYIGLDQYDRRYVRWVETVAMVAFCALIWPLLLVRRPKCILKPSDLYEWDSTRAGFDRERDRLMRDLKRCTNRIRFEAHNKGKMIGEFEFPSDAIAAYLAHRTDKDGYGNINDLSEVKQWVDNADLLNAQASEIPWVWTSFNLLAAELASLGVGDCFCGTCRTHYFATELESGSGDGSPGWIAVIIKCPKGHEVMKFDLLKPFCSHRRNPEPESDHVPKTEPHVPSFLMKKS